MQIIVVALSLLTDIHGKVEGQTITPSRHGTMLFLLVAVSVLTTIYGYVGFRTIRPAPLAPCWKKSLWILLAGLWLLPPLPILLRRSGFEGFPVDLLSWIAYLTLGFFMLAFCMLVSADLARLALHFFGKIIRFARGDFTLQGEAGTPVDLGRRGLLAYPVNLGILGVSGALNTYGYIEATKSPTVVRIKVPLPNLPPEFEGFRIAQLTDIHVGPMIKQKFIGDIVDQTNALEPDLIAITGDLVDGTVPHLRNAVSPLASLSAAQGNYFITGNHEYYSGAEAWVEEMDRLGMKVLLNDNRVLERGKARLLIAGVTDPNGAQYVKGHRPDLKKASASATPVDVKLLLSHQPRTIDAAVRNGFDLQISGHTHGGQFIPWNILVGLTQPYIKGLHNHQGTWIYVSRGTGYWGPPIRLGTYSEITLLELTSGKIRETS